jgi:hypothetical protein
LPQVLSVHDGTQGPEHVPLLEHVLPAEQAPQVPPQPSSPHCLPVQSGTQISSHLPAAVQLSPKSHVPHSPPQPLSPHCLLVQLGVHVAQSGSAEQLTPGQMPSGRLLHSQPMPNGPLGRATQE